MLPLLEHPLTQKLRNSLNLFSQQPREGIAMLPILQMKKCSKVLGLINNSIGVGAKLPTPCPFTNPCLSIQQIA